MSTSINPIGNNAVTPGATIASTTTTVAATNDPLANQSTFLRLLVSQLQNQDPLSPVDSNQFVSQLTAYSQLEQLIGIHKDTTALGQPAAATPSTGSTASGSTNTGSAGATTNP